MSEKKIVVPEGMLKAARKRFSEAIRLCSGSIPDIESPLEAACRWLSENPIVPTDAQYKDLWDYYMSRADRIRPTRWICDEWQRRMFLASEPEIPDEIEDLLPFPPDVVIPGDDLYRQVKAHLDNVATEAFRRGQKAGPR